MTVSVCQNMIKCLLCSRAKFAILVVDGIRMPFFSNRIATLQSEHLLPT
ncbi:RAxF-45 family protein [Amphibacillus sediminis]|nr:RAxF-45 family protein [Amphibacillus sediminis]